MAPTKQHTGTPAHQLRILVGLSGGVDSAVSAYLLKEQGYEVACGFMINYLDEEDPGSCPTLADLEEAKRVAEFLELPLYTFDYREEYEKRIVEYIYHEYEAGRTPNPDVFCNNLVKFDLFLEEGLSLGFDKIATGHYARIEEGSRVREFEDSSEPTNLRTYSLLKGIDPTKDQSYFLSRLSKEQLSKAIFPIGGLMKSEVRAIAKRVGLPNAERKDSQGLCFIGKVSMKEFLEKRIPKKPGKILDTSGRAVGEHEGAYSYTIGQRKGIKVGGGPALFVVAKDIPANTITVGPESELRLYSSHCELIDWVGETPVEGKKYGAKIRYRQEDQECTIVNRDSRFEIRKSSHCEEGNDVAIQNQISSESTGSPHSSNIPFPMTRHSRCTNFELRFTTPQRAITPGQIAVIYGGDRVIGSGIIAGGSFCKN